jgi:peptidyl-prolyl cis-trans isomerase C
MKVLGLKMKRYLYVVKIIFLLSLSALEFAKDKLPNGVAATVNASNISEATLDDAVKALTSRGQAQDTPKLRQAILEELIAREVLIQEVGKLGLEKTPDAQKELIQLRKNFLIGKLMKQFSDKNPVNEPEIKAEYDKQLKLNQQAPQKELKLSGMLFKTEADAQSALTRVKSGEAFDKVAREKSIGPTRDKGGDMGWILPKALMPEMAQSLTNVTRGNITPAPFKSRLGWHLLKVEDERAFKFPSYEEAKGQIANFIDNSKRSAYVKKLRDSAKVATNY